MKPKNLLCLHCNCGECHLHIQRDSDGEWFFECTNAPEPFYSWRQRLKHVWKILRGKPICLGDVILSDQDIVELKEYIETHLPSNKVRQLKQGELHVQKNKVVYPARQKRMGRM